MNMRKFMYVAAVAVAACALSACSNSNSDKAGSEAANTEATEATSDAADNAEATAETSSAKVINLKDDNELRPNKTYDQAVFLDFNATWCIPCKKFGPTFEASAAKYGDKAKFYSVDIDENVETAKAFGIESVPTIIVIKKDGTVERFVGIGDVLPSEKFEAIVEKAL
jgi:thioredoxin 1